MKRMTLLLVLVLTATLGFAQQDWENATKITSGATVQSAFGKEGDITSHWYCIDVPEEGSITLTTRSETTLRLGIADVQALHDDGRIYSRGSQDMDSYNADADVVFNLDGLAFGTYYIQLKHYAGAGAYSLHYRFTPCATVADPEPNNDFENAAPMEIDVVQNGRLGYSYFAVADTKDWYRIELPEEGDLEMAVHSDPQLQLGRMYIYGLFHGETKEIDSFDFDNYGKDTTLVHTFAGLSASTFYIQQMHWNGVGGYTIMPRFRPCNYPADPEPNNSHEQASLLVNGTVQHGRLGYANGGEIDTEDWFRIETKNDSRAELTFYADTLLRLGWMEFFQLQADGELASLYTLDLDNYNKDTTFHISVDALGEGTYFLRMKQYAGHGGYRIKFNCVENPFSRHNTPNTTFATRTPIEVGKEAAGTIGYRSTTGRRTEAWYSIATGARADVSVSIKPDTTLSLSLGMCYLYRFEGYDEDGDPRLVHVAENRIERSEGSLTYVREQGDNAEYVLKIEHYDGCGGYTVTNGNSNATGATDVVISVGGRNTIRKGVPCENPVTLTNTAFHATKPFFVVFACTPEFSITGFKLQKEWGEEYVPIEEMGESDTTAVFLVPSLNPGERYTITMISEGRGDISYIKTRAVTASAIAVGIVSDLAADVAKDAICDYVIDAVANKVDLDKREAEQYASVMGLTVEQLGMEKQRTGVAAYTATSFFKAGVQKVTEKIPGGKILNTLGSVGEATANLSNSLRRRLWHWIYKETGLINDDKMGVSDGKMVASDVVSSWDPNEMVGPAGYGTAHFIGHTQTITYRILFENKAEAGAPAWRVRIFDELDPEVFNLETVRFGTTSHEGDAYQWETTREGGRLSWDIKGIELPPNVHAPEGEGWVEFSVDLKPGLPSGTQLKNKATIIFDKNTPIETNEYVNTLDLDAPASQMALEPYTPGANHLAFQLHATETGSGVSHYLLFVAEGEDGTFENCGPVWRSRLEFPIDPSQATTYQFFVVAVDNVGNAEQAQPKPITVHTATGINTILNTDAIKAIYGPDGTQRPHLQRGINIIHTKNGKARKVMLR